MNHSIWRSEVSARTHEIAVITDIGGIKREEVKIIRVYKKDRMRLPAIILSDK
jgi:hypothetical protein